MKILEKLTSKKGQVSMEIGILVAAAVAVAAIAAYFYVKNAKAASQGAGDQASAAAKQLTQKASEYVNSIANL
jgi:uncharacterized protein (UPF0333 family)